MWLCLGPCQHKREAGVVRGFIPDTVMVVTAGVMPASLKSKESVNIATILFTHTHTHCIFGLCSLFSLQDPNR